MDTRESTTPARPKRNSAPQLTLPLRTPDGDWSIPLYMKVGAQFERAPDAVVIERAQELIAADFRPGASIVTSVAQVIDFLRLQIGGRDEEVFAVMLLDKRRRFIGYEELFHGTVDTAKVEVRRVLACVVRSRASAVICAHNHPQGGCEPSHADVRITYQLYRVLKMLDVELLDHIIVGESVLSFQERGWMREPWLALRASD
ncbi:MAG TPA: JAB domain-containing protein [Steroidobacteraceae bacterium]|jgi:DNA repair protein RadC|nr:JAB domain-containing protein [Steroidobacteraceae bacterium]